MSERANWRVRKEVQGWWCERIVSMMVMEMVMQRVMERVMV